MGFEKWKPKPPQAIIQAAMAEDSEALRSIASKGGRAAAEKRKAEKAAVVAAKEKAEKERAAEIKILNEEDRRIFERDARRHAREMPQTDD